VSTVNNTVHVQYTFNLLCSSLSFYRKNTSYIISLCPETKQKGVPCQLFLRWLQDVDCKDKGKNKTCISLWKKTWNELNSGSITFCSMTMSIKSTTKNMFRHRVTSFIHNINILCSLQYPTQRVFKWNMLLHCIEQSQINTYEKEARFYYSKYLFSFKLHCRK
jgi:hypothetical protein